MGALSKQFTMILNGILQCILEIDVRSLSRDSRSRVLPTALSSVSREDGLEVCVCRAETWGSKPCSQLWIFVELWPLHVGQVLPCLAPSKG